jgi:hypothetical protein
MVQKKGVSVRVSFENRIPIYDYSTNRVNQKRSESARNCSRTRSHSHSFSVPGAGVEPAQYCYYWCLRPARLPVPPSGQILIARSCHQGVLLDCENRKNICYYIPLAPFKGEINYNKLFKTSTFQPFYLFTFILYLFQSFL